MKEKKKKKEDLPLFFIGFLSNKYISPQSRNRVKTLMHVLALELLQLSM